jgi:hypothetical protein
MPTNSIEKILKTAKAKVSVAVRLVERLDFLDLDLTGIIIFPDKTSISTCSGAILYSWPLHTPENRVNPALVLGMSAILGATHFLKVRRTWIS